MMKYLILGMLMIFFLFCGCDRNVNEIPVEIKISNETGKSLEIRVFESVSQAFVKKIEIADGKMVSRVFIEKESDSPIGPKDFFEGDSLSVVFGTNEKILTYQCQYFISSESCTIEGNILNISDLRWQLGNSGETVVRSYTFLTEDFENATPCDGNCE